MSKSHRKRHSPEQIVKKLRDADAMLSAGQDLSAVLQALEISEQTYYRWRNQYGGMKSEEAKRLAPHLVAEATHPVMDGLGGPPCGDTPGTWGITPEPKVPPSGPL